MAAEEAALDEYRAVQRGEKQHAVPEAFAARAPPGYVGLLYELWAHDPSARPDFAETLRRLRGMRANATATALFERARPRPYFTKDATASIARATE